MAASGESTSYSIVLRGSMNCAIHHPLWYERAQLLSETERTSALYSDQTFTTAHSSQVTLPIFTISCHRDKWNIQTDREEQLGRVRRICEDVFDKVLPHTPIHHYGVNVEHVQTTACPNIGELLAQKLLSIPLGLAFPEHVRGEEIKLKAEFNNRTVSVTIGPGKTPPDLRVFVNNHYEIHESGQFNIADRLTATFDRDVKASLEFSRSIREALIGGE